jgi:hypothetical protein
MGLSGSGWLCLVYKFEERGVILAGPFFATDWVEDAPAGATVLDEANSYSTNSSLQVSLESKCARKSPANVVVEVQILASAVPNSFASPWHHGFDCRSGLAATKCAIIPSPQTRLCRRRRGAFCLCHPKSKD